MKKTLASLGLISLPLISSADDLRFECETTHGTTVPFEVAVDGRQILTGHLRRPMYNIVQQTPGAIWFKGIVGKSGAETLSIISWIDGGVWTDVTIDEAGDVSENHYGTCTRGTAL